MKEGIKVYRVPLVLHIKAHNEYEAHQLAESWLAAAQNSAPEVDTLHNLEMDTRRVVGS